MTETTKYDTGSWIEPYIIKSLGALTNEENGFILKKKEF